MANRQECGSHKEFCMVTASELKQGMAIRLDGEPYKLLEVETKAGAAKLGGLVKARLQNARTGRVWEQHFRFQERLEELELERHVLEFLYSDESTCTFMRPDTFEQVTVPKSIVGHAEKFLQPGMELPVEFFESEPINVIFPDVCEARVSNTMPPTHSQQEAAWKEATLENGLRIRVPMFVGPAETVRVEVKSCRYVDRVRPERKKST